jgi:hypothetical protein
MSFAPLPKRQGDLLRSQDWNDLVAELQRLDNTKVSRAGDAISGSLTVSGALAVGGASLPNVTLNVESSANIQIRARQSGNTNFARVVLNANNNEFHLSVGAPGTGALANTFSVFSASANRNLLSVLADGRVQVSGILEVSQDLRVTQDLTVRQIYSNQFNVSQVFETRQGPLPREGNFTANGGTMLFIVAGSGFSTVAGRQIGMSVVVNGTNIGNARCFTNEASSHKTFSSVAMIASNVAAGQATVRLEALAGTSTDGNDFFNVTVIELPFVKNIFNPIIGITPIGIGPVVQ